MELKLKLACFAFLLITLASSAHCELAVIERLIIAQSIFDSDSLTYEKMKSSMQSQPESLYTDPRAISTQSETNSWDKSDVPMTDNTADAIGSVGLFPSAQLSEIIYDSAKFILNRAREELVKAHLKDVLVGVDSLRTKFGNEFAENTYRVLYANQYSGIESYINQLRSAMQRDVLLLPKVISVSDSFRHNFDSNFSADIASLTVYMLDNISQGRNPLDVFLALDKDSSFSIYPRLIDSELKTRVTLLSSVVKDFKASPETYSGLPILLKTLYVEVLAEQLKRTDPKDRERIKFYCNSLGGIYSQYTKMKATNALSEQRFISRQVIAAVVDMLLSPEFGVSNQDREVVNTLHEAIIAASDGEYSRAALASLSLLKQETDSNKGSVKLITFMIAMIEAKEKKDIVKVLTETVEPLGGFERKDDRFTVSITSYPGLGYSHAPAGGFRGGTFSLPIGFELSWGEDHRSVHEKKKPKEANSKGTALVPKGLLLFPVDLACAVHPIATEQEEDQRPELDWNDILSPGIAFVWRPWAGNSPLSLLLSAQYRRQTFITDLEGSQHEVSRSMQYMASVGVDVTLLFLHKGKGKTPFD